MAFSVLKISTLLTKLTSHHAWRTWVWTRGPSQACEDEWCLYSLPSFSRSPSSHPYFQRTERKGKEDSLDYLTWFYYFKKIFSLHGCTEKQNSNNIRHSRVARKRLEEIKIFFQFIILNFTILCYEAWTCGLWTWSKEPGNVLN